MHAARARKLVETLGLQSNAGRHTYRYGRDFIHLNKFAVTSRGEAIIPSGMFGKVTIAEFAEEQQKLQGSDKSSLVRISKSTISEV